MQNSLLAGWGRGWRVAGAALGLGWLAFSDARAADEDPWLVAGPPMLRNWVQPEYPDFAKKEKLEGSVKVDFGVDAAGNVVWANASASSDPRFEAAALAAVKQWKFKPAMDEKGTTLAAAMSAPVNFSLAQLKQKRVPLLPANLHELHVLPSKPAEVKSAPDPDYPEELEARRLPGEVQMEFTVDESGLPEKPVVKWASNAAFVEAALRALEKTEFEPAKQGPTSVKSKMAYPVRFTSQGIRRDALLAANHLSFSPESPTNDAPEAYVISEPVYPADALWAGESGEAEVRFRVTERGDVENAIVLSASAPEFGWALRTAVENWGFRPANGADGHTVPVVLVARHEFRPPTRGAEARLLELIKSGAGVGGAGGLDRPLTPLWRGFPTYPPGLRVSGETGRSEVEFIIDRGGRVRLPRAISATREEFGYAAAMAVSQWVFARPLRGGEPVDVKVRIEIGFTPPKT